MSPALMYMVIKGKLNKTNTHASVCVWFNSKSKLELELKN